MLGWCYRLRIRSKTETYTKQMVRESKKAKTALQDEDMKPTPATVLALEDGSLESDDSSSTSSSSTSSSPDKKHKKKKSKKDAKKAKKDKKKKHTKKDKKDKKPKREKEETVAERRAREAQERQAAKAEEKLGLQQVKAAQMVITKVAAPLLNARGVMDRPNFSYVAASIKEPLVAVFNKLSGIQDQADAVVERGAGEVEADVKTLARDLNTLRQQSALATSMMALMERSSRGRV